MTPERFRKYVAEALENLPKAFQEKMENVGVIVEDFADPGTLDSLGIESPWGLLGLYVGVPINQRSVFWLSTMPDRIYLYRKPIIAAAGDPNKIVATIRDVLVHEVGHHFGFSDDELYEMTRDAK